MTKEPDTYVYVLRRGKEIVYVGITEDLKRREDEHRNDGKQFDRLVPAKEEPMTRSEALKKEQEILSHYRKLHNGKNPKYNAQNS